MKSFEDFINSLSKEDVEYIHQISDEKIKDFEGNINSQQGITDLCAYVVNMAFTSSIRLLSVYHRWLEENSDR